MLLHELLHDPDTLPRVDAFQRVMGFARRYGSAHVTLAMHAALPLGLTPDMLHLIRINFVRNAPWIAEADILLSPLCREVGGELYEMAPDTRELLLDELQSDPEFGTSRLEAVANFLHEYSERALRGMNRNAPAEMHDFYQAQQWAALAYTQPEDAAQSLALALKQGLQAKSQADVARVTRLTHGLATPLISQETILIYSAAVEKAATGQRRSAQDFFKTLGPLDKAVSIGGVELPAPALILPAAQPVTKQTITTEIKTPTRSGKGTILSLDVLRARHGDCLLLHYGSSKDPGLAIIDGGPANVYRPYLKPRLLQIREAQKLDPNRPLTVDLLMVTHASDEHMRGILDLTRELVEAKESMEPALFTVNRCWHNSLDDLIGDSPRELIAGITAQFGSAALSSDAEVQDLDPDAAKVLASANEGFRLRDDMRGLKVRLNPEHKGVLITNQKGARIDMGKGLKFTVLCPMKHEVEALRKAHDFLRKQGKEKQTAVSFGEFSTSAANSSSIVVLAEMEHKRILLTGDARGDKVLQGLEQAGLLKKDGTSSLHVDVLKVPQHGSSRSIAPDFFQRVTADHYVFSGDGERGCPERETLEMLMNARSSDKYTIHFTYPITQLDTKRKEYWKDEQTKERRKRTGTPSQTIRPSWSNKSQSLQSFFNEHPQFAKKVVIVPEDRPHTIDLLDLI